MEVIKLKRNAGKTSSIVEWLKKSPETRIMVVCNYQEKQRVMQEFGLEINNVWTFADVMASRPFAYAGRGEMMIDNLDICLRQAIPYSDCYKLAGFSITDE